MIHNVYSFNSVSNLLRKGLLALSLVVGGLLFTLPVVAQEPAAGSPTESVKNTVDSILAILRKPDFDVAKDAPAVSELVKASFDSTAMAQSVLGNHWRTATPEQREEFRTLLLQTLEATYLNRIDAYTNETVEFVKEDLRNDRATVYSEINAAQGPIPVNYKLRKRDDGWFLYDVEVENVSMVSSYRDTYGAIVSRDGVDGLLEQMRARTAPEPEV
jgi:phospholipid transport system substrate-binding protein